jgi:hypothetical protein
VHEGHDGHELSRCTMYVDRSWLQLVQLLTVCTRKGLKGQMGKRQRGVSSEDRVTWFMFYFRMLDFLVSSVGRSLIYGYFWSTSLNWRKFVRVSQLLEKHPQSDRYCGSGTVSLGWELEKST